ncbi:HD domain-containing protein [Rufibacter immobilis]|uniref:HD domain-containing protein n=1 Tax=Rufibacter immobilis TaxID=1348778 RepID=UPI0035F01FBD
MWNELSIEEKMKAALVQQFGKDKGNKYYVQYATARDYLVDEIFPQIRGVEPSLSEHDATHIQNVLGNAEFLLGDDIEKLDGINLYCLCLVILFHDVGNIHGRKNHNKFNKIATVYDEVRKRDAKYNHERNVVIRAAQAHSGKSSSGSNDTLKDLPPTDHIYGHTIKLRDIASILRFADELAEGPQRTSEFMQAHHKYDPKSLPFHKYASITNIHIDRPNERITLTYHIYLDRKTKKFTTKTEKEFKELLSFTYKRILKLDQERKYTKHYSDFLSPFKKTSVKLNIYINGELQELELNEINLTDIVVPGEDCKDIFELDSAYKVENILESLKNSKS